MIRCVSNVLYRMEDIIRFAYQPAKRHLIHYVTTSELDRPWSPEYAPSTSYPLY